MYVYSGPSLGSWGRRESPLAGLGQEATTWMDSSEQRAFRERVLKAHIAQQKGTPHHDLPIASLAPVLGTKSLSEKQRKINHLVSDC